LHSHSRPRILKLNALALVVAQPGRLRDGWRALLLAMPQIESVSLGDDPAAALGMARKQRPNLVLLDIEPFGDEGWAVLQQIKAEQPQCHSMVLAGDARQVREARSAGAGAVLMKGFRRWGSSRRCDSYCPNKEVFHMVTLLCTDVIPKSLVDWIGSMLPPGVEMDCVEDDSDEELARRATDAEILLPRGRPVDARLLALAPRARFVQLAGSATTAWMSPR
jgi:CheY-like chemotaxis protein